MNPIDKLIFEVSRSGRVAYSLPDCDVPVCHPSDMIPDTLLREQAPALPKVSEAGLVRHFTRLSQKNYGVDAGFYPLGSCTMKYNPKLNEVAARLPGFSAVHPAQPAESVQGALALLYDLDTMLCKITGMARFTMQPAAGAHGEMTGLMIIKAYHESRSDKKRTKILIPDSAHGTNPASAALAGFEVVNVRSNDKGMVDIDALERLLDEETAGLMLTNPNTLGLFDTGIKNIADKVHAAGGLLYYDGANLNAVIGVARPADMGFDVVHLNLHKTFSTPHGGGGPGSGPVGVRQDLVEFLPGPIVEKSSGGYMLNANRPLSIGRIRSFYGNFGVAVKAYAYILSMGADGLKQAAENAVLNANYVQCRLKERYDLPYDTVCMHETVLSAKKQTAHGISALDIAKRLIDFGYHPPTIYFPLIVKEALMIEPTETESKETLDGFIEALLHIANEAEETPEALKAAPQTTALSRMDETRAVRQPVLAYRPE